MTAPGETAPSPSAPAPAPAEERPRCRCGTDRSSKFSIVDRDYTFLGTLYLLWGGTSVPSKVTFRCVKCGQTIETSTRRALCREYIT